MTYYAHHICIKVSDIDRSRAFYENALQFHETGLIHHTPSVTSCFMVSADGALQIQLLQCAGQLPEHQSYGHLGMRTECISSSYAAHEAMGCISQAIVEQPHQLNYFIKDPDGYETEIVQPKNQNKR